MLHERSTLTVVAGFPISQGGFLYLAVAEVGPDVPLGLLAFRGKAKYLNGLRGWVIRCDPRVVFERQESHYHCERTTDGTGKGETYVITASGRGSHFTTSGTKLPGRLGRYLFEELNIPLKRVGNNYLVHLLIAPRVSAGVSLWAEYLESLLTAPLIKERPIHPTNEYLRVFLIRA